MKTKIVATIGPSCASYEKIEKLVEAGLDIARFNFSHVTYDEFKERVGHVRRAAKKLKKEVLILQDLQGPRIRVGILPPEGRELKEGDTVIFSTKKEKDDNIIYIDNPYLHVDLKVGEPIYLANGDIELRSTKIQGQKIWAKVERPGILHSRKAVNVPHTKLTTSGLVAKDIKDAKFGLANKVDYIAISFVQTAADVLKLRKIVKDKAKIMSKIETALALQNIDPIIQASDAIMVARGDLGIEIPGEKVPSVQKNLVRHAAWHGKGSVVATQMLISMVTHPRPTRAEVSDVANAVWDGADGVMLSDETASGKHPITSLKTLVKIVKEAETYRNKENYLVPKP